MGLGLYVDPELGLLSDYCLLAVVFHDIEKDLFLFLVREVLVEAVVVDELVVVLHVVFHIHLLFGITGHFGS